MSRPVSSVPLLWRILGTDPVSYFSLVLVIGVWTVYGLSHLLTFESGRLSSRYDLGLARIWLLLFSGLATLALVPWAVHRVAVRYRLIRGGESVPGRAMRITAFCGYALVRYGYTFGTGHHLGRAFIHQTARSARLRGRQEVRVLLDPSRPSRSVVREIYLEEDE